MKVEERIKAQVLQSKLPEKQQAVRESLMHLTVNLLWALEKSSASNISGVIAAKEMYDGDTIGEARIQIEVVGEELRNFLGRGLEIGEGDGYTVCRIAMILMNISVNLNSETLTSDGAGVIMSSISATEKVRTLSQERIEMFLKDLAYLDSMPKSEYRDDRKKYLNNLLELNRAGLNVLDRLLRVHSYNPDMV